MILYKRRFWLLLILLLMILSKSFGQDPHFSQFYANPIYLNPAFSGTGICPRFSINFRDQWPSIPRNFLSFSGSYDQHIPEIHGGVGLLFSGDIAGAGFSQTYNAGFIYNFRTEVARQFYLQFALQGNFLHTSINGDKWIFASNIVNSNAPADFPEDKIKHFSKSQFDGSFGFVGYTPYLYFGLAIHHLIPLQVNYFRNMNKKLEKVWEPKWSAHIGGKITLRKKIKSEVNFGDIYLHPNILFISQGKFHYLHEGLYFNFYPLTIGAWLRHNFQNFDAFIVSCGVEYKFLRIGYSYDFPLTKLERTGGAHEISLQFTIPCDVDKMGKTTKKKRSKFYSVPCPNF